MSSFRSKLYSFRRIPKASPIDVGVCAGIGYSLGVPSWLVRLILVAVVIVSFRMEFLFLPTVILYFLLAVFVPTAKVPEDFRG